MGNKGSMQHWQRFSIGCIITLVLTGTSAQQPITELNEKSLGLDQIAALRTSQAVLGNQISDFVLLDREGRPVSLSRYRGKPLLVSMIYTGCFQVCPVSTRNLQDVLVNGKGHFDTKQFNVISIGFNQPSDTPQSLKSFALQHHLTQSNWDFLSPHSNIVAPLAQELGFSFMLTPAGFDHISQVTLLDAQGRIYRQIYDDELNVKSLGETFKQLLSNAPISQNLNIKELVNRVRILCTVYDPATGAYRVQYGLLIEVAGGVTFAISMAWFFLAEWLGRRRAGRRLTRTWTLPVSTSSFTKHDR